MNSHLLGNLQSLQLGRVTDNADPDNRGRVRVRLQSAPMEVWAGVVAPSAGQGYGASFVPRIDEIVVLAFVSPELPLVLGSIWSGSESVPEECDPQDPHIAKVQHVCEGAKGRSCASAFRKARHLAKLEGRVVIDGDRLDRIDRLVLGCVAEYRLHREFKNHGNRQQKNSSANTALGEIVF